MLGHGPRFLLALLVLSPALGGCVGGSSDGGALPADALALAIRSPREGEHVTGTLIVEGPASFPRSGGNARDVEFRIDDGPWQPTTVGREDGAWSWLALFDARELADGAHTVEARAYDGAAYSAVVAVGFVTGPYVPPKYFYFASAGPLEEGPPATKSYSVTSASANLTWSDVGFVAEGVAFAFAPAADTGACSAPASGEMAICRGGSSLGADAAVEEGDVLTVAWDGPLRGAQARFVDADTGMALVAFTVT